MAEMEKLNSKEFKIVGFVTNVIERVNKSNKPYGRVTLEDYSGTYEHLFWAKHWVEFANYFKPNYDGPAKSRFRAPSRLCGKRAVRGFALKIPSCLRSWRRVVGI
jgi:hypothetical protein